jgi:hypothetical protein
MAARAIAALPTGARAEERKETSMSHFPQRRGYLKLTAWAAVLVLLAAIPTPTALAQTVTRYIFTAFTNSSESNMYVYQSSDGLNFSLLHGPAYTPPSGLVRDPSIMKHTDGYYYILYTTNWTGTNFGIARSSNLTTWTYYTTVNISNPTPVNTWAPEWYIEGSTINVIVSLSSGSYGPFKAYKLTAQNSALTSWSAPAELTGIGPNYIDTFIVKLGSTYHAFSKNETTKYIEHATATSLTGPYTWVGTGNWAGWGSGKEGPSIFQLDNGQWRIFMDCYTGCGYLTATSSNLNTWSGTSTVPGGLSGFIRHGTVMKETVSAPIYHRLTARHSSKCAGVNGSATTDGATVVQQTCGSGNSQQWQFQDLGNGYYRVLNRNSGKCLDVTSGATADGATVIQWACNSGNNQQWQLQAAGSYYRLVARHSSKCLDVSASSTADGAKIHQWTCNGGNNQQWSRPQV